MNISTKRVAMLSLFALVMLGGNCPNGCPPGGGQGGDAGTGGSSTGGSGTGGSGTGCPALGGTGLFVADFESDTVGSPPAATTANGPPGAALTCSGPAGTFTVVDSAALGSKALRISRGNFEPTVCEVVPGQIGGGANDSGRFQIRFRAHGETVPQHLIAGVAVAAMTRFDLALNPLDPGPTVERFAFNSKLYDGSYHLLKGDQSQQLSGSYDPESAHKVVAELDLDSSRFSICIDDELVASDEPFSETLPFFGILRFFAPGTVTEAFPMAYVVDDIRVNK